MPLLSLKKIRLTEKITSQTILHDASYQHISRDPTARIKQENTSPLKSSDNLIETLKELIPKESVAPHIYGLPKIHRPDIPFDLYSVPLANYKPEKYLVCLLQPLLFLLSFFINSTYFVWLISTIILDLNDCLVSFYVASLFTKVPVNDLITFIRQLNQQVFLLFAACIFRYYIV